MARVSSPPQSRSKAVVCVSSPRMYPHSGYFLVQVYKVCLNSYRNHEITRRYRKQKNQKINDVRATLAPCIPSAVSHCLHFRLNLNNLGIQRLFKVLRSASYISQFTIYVPRILIQERKSFISLPYNNAISFLFCNHFGPSLRKSMY